MRALDSLSKHLQHAGVAFIEVEGDDVGIAIDAKHELGEVVRSDRQTIEERCDPNRLHGA